MLVGQNPGAEEDETGRPFVGRAGKYLTAVLAEYGVKRDEVFVTNIVKHITPKNRCPFKDEVEVCVPYLEAQIEIIKPKKVLLFGRVACKVHVLKGLNTLSLYILRLLPVSRKLIENYGNNCNR